MKYTCAVCRGTILPNDSGKVRLEGVTESPRGKAWVWGPVPVHENCRLDLATPFDEGVGDRYIRTSDFLTARDAAEPE